MSVHQVVGRAMRGALLLCVVPAVVSAQVKKPKPQDSVKLAKSVVS